MSGEYSIDESKEGTVLNHENQVEFDIAEDLLTAFLWRAIGCIGRYVKDDKNIVFRDDLSILELHKTDTSFAIHYVCGSDNEYERLLSSKRDKDDSHSLWAVFEYIDGVAVDVVAVDDTKVLDARDYALLVHMRKFVGTLNFFDNLAEER